MVVLPEGCFSARTTRPAAELVAIAAAVLAIGPAERWYERAIRPLCGGLSVRDHRAASARARGALAKNDRLERD